jgi:hypothetical protein
MIAQLFKVTEIVIEIDSSRYTVFVRLIKSLINVTFRNSQYSDSNIGLKAALTECLGGLNSIHK